MILGLTGRKRSGKSTLARLLVERHGFRELSFAARLKKMAVDVNPMVHYLDTFVPSDIDRELLANGVTPGPVYLLDALRVLGEERAKDELPEVRRFYQRLGTEGVRGNLGEDTWVNLAEREIRAAGYARRLVFPDVRFDNEANLIRWFGGTVVEVQRPAAIPDTVDNHRSEQLEVTPDRVVTNVEGDPESAFNAIVKILRLNRR